MGAINPDNVRNVILAAHGGAGKTSLAESMLFLSKAINTKGSVEHGTATLTIEPEESIHHCTIAPHFANLTWKEKAITLADSPGYFSFLESTRGVLPGMDGAILLASATTGIKPEGQRLWSMLKDYEIPTIVFVNKLDHEQADFEKALTEIEETLGIPTRPVTIPLRENNALTGIIDIVHRKAFTSENGRSKEVPVPGEFLEQVEVLRTELVEQIAETDESLIESYLECGDLTDAELRSGLKTAVAEKAFVPVFSGSATTDAGVEILLGAITLCLPSPEDRARLHPATGVDPANPEKEFELSCSNEAPFSALTLRTSIDPFSGKLSVIRVLSGTISAHEHILNGSKRKKQTAGHLYKLQGKELSEVQKLYTGEIGAISKLDETFTGDTLSSTDHAIVYPQVHFADPSISYAVAVEGKTEDKVASGLRKLLAEDPTLRVSRDEQTHEMILSGMSQNHLSVSLEILERKFGGKATLQTPRVPYRETIRKLVKVQGKLKKQTGGRGQFANCWIQVEPLPRGTGFKFEDQIVGGVIPKQYIPSVEKGVQEAMNTGTMGGYPVVDVRVSLVDGSFHRVDSSDYAFQVAGGIAFKSAEEEAEAVLLEPIMSMEIVVPEAYTGDVVKDITSKRGRVLGMETKGGKQTIKAEAPMPEVLEYGNILNSITAGQGMYAMNLETYREVPGHLAEKILEGKKATAH